MEPNREEACHSLGGSLLQDLEQRRFVLAALRDHAQILRCIAWSPDGAKLVTASWDATLRVWSLVHDADTDGCIAELTGHNDHVYCASWSPNGQVIASASGDK